MDINDKKIEKSIRDIEVKNEKNNKILVEYCVCV